MPSIRSPRKSSRARKPRGELAAPVRCPKCWHPLPGPIPARAVRLTEVALRSGGEIGSREVAAALETNPKNAAHMLRAAAASGILHRSIHSLPRGGLVYSYAPIPDVAVAFVPSEHLARQLRALTRVAPVARLG